MASLINSFSIETPKGLRSFHLHWGDICDSKDELIVVSTHANPSLPPTGQVLVAIESKYKCDFSKMEPLLISKETAGTYWLNHEDRRFLIVRFPGAENIQKRGDDPLKVFEEIVLTLFGSLAALEFKGERYRSMAFPVIAESRGFQVQDALRIVVSTAIRWLRLSNHMEEVSLYVFERFEYEQWSKEMDRLLGRQYFALAKSASLEGAREELIGLLKKVEVSGLVQPTPSWLSRLREAVSSEVICPQKTATNGRLMSEDIVAHMLNEVGKQWKKDLFKHIEELRQAGHLSAWFANYLNSLRNAGNAEVHLEKSASAASILTEADTHWLLFTINRAIENWLAMAHSTVKNVGVSHPGANGVVEQSEAD